MAKGKWFFVRESLSVSTSMSVPIQTGPLQVLHDKEILVLADLENLVAGARQLDCELSLERLAGQLSSASNSCRLFGFTSVSVMEQDRPLGYVCSDDWEIVCKSGEFLEPATSKSAGRNSDNLLLYQAGSLLERIPCEVVVIGSGDGSLVCSLARFIRDADPSKHVVSLSVAGSTSSRLDCVRNADLAANAFLGLDCLRPTLIAVS